MRRHTNATPRQQPYLRQWREAYGMTLRELSKATKISTASLSKFETGERRYYQEVIEAYAMALGVDPGAIVSGPPDASTARMLAVWAKLTVNERNRLIAMIEAFASSSAANIAAAILASAFSMPWCIDALMRHCHGVFS